MARRRRRSSVVRSATAARGRDIRNYQRIARRNWDRPPVLAPRRRPRVVPAQDRRLFEPAGVRRARLVTGEPAQIRPGRSLPGRFPSPRVVFHAPRKVMICVRRHRRREVLFARGVAGSRGIRRRRLNEWSNVKC